MALAVLYSRANLGITAPLVTVEVHISNGLPAMSIVGLPETAVKESKDRVRGAIINSEFEFPQRRITINLAPADLPKDSGRYDLAIALGILAASNQISCKDLNKYEFFGELALSGHVRSIKGLLPAAIKAAKCKRELIIPHDNLHEATLVNETKTFGIFHLLDICAHLNQSKTLSCASQNTKDTETKNTHPDLSDIYAQHHAKRALEICAAGGHSLLMIGPPGTGKTMLASRLPGILPKMQKKEALESAAIASISHNGFDSKSWGIRPFRSPHHTASGVALVGGGSQPRPGEISLAHNGVMFLDELPEFSRQVLEVLREPLESGKITISRAARQAEYPAKFQLVAAMNPCPCGYLGDHKGRCNCTADQVSRYRGKISGPLLDRIDMHIEVSFIPTEKLKNQPTEKSESSKDVRQRVNQARSIQLNRRGKANHAMSSKEVGIDCTLNKNDHDFLINACEKLGLSMRSIHRIQKVARTIADLDQCDQISINHLSEALSFRCLDRKYSAN